MRVYLGESLQGIINPVAEGRYVPEEPETPIQPGVSAHIENLKVYSEKSNSIIEITEALTPSVLKAIELEMLNL